MQEKFLKPELKRSRKLLRDADETKDAQMIQQIFSTSRKKNQPKKASLTYLNGFWRHTNTNKTSFSRERSESERAFTCARARASSPPFPPRETALF